MHGPYTWSQKSYSYRDARGRYVSAKQVRDWLDSALEQTGRRMEAASVALRERRISLAEWQTEMMREIRSAHLYSTAAAKGGWAQLTAADFGRAGQRIRAQYEYLRTFAAQLSTGAQALDGRLLQRAKMYGEAGRGSFHATERREMENRGNTEERSVLHPADHCDGCVEEAARGWVDIGKIVPIGQRPCRTRCRCTMEYR